MTGPEDYEIGEIPAAVFTGGLDFDQEVTLQTISECLTRGESYTRALSEGNKEMMHEFEPLARLLLGISMGSIVPILRNIQEGDDPGQAIRSVIAGVGGLMFFGGIEYAKAMGLNGVGVSIPAKQYAADEYPEEKPRGGSSLAEILQANFSGSDEEED